MRVYQKQYKDITGKIYNNLIALEYVETKNNRAWWKFKCDCGNIIELNAKSVRTGNTKSCGCRKLKHPPKNIKGKRFGYLVAQECVENRNKQYWWECKCDCGKTKLVQSSLLTSGGVKSCGCLVSEIITKRNKLRRGSKHPSWRNDISIEEKQLRKSERKYSDPRLNRWRKKVYTRDGYTCQKCKNNVGGNLVAHHIYSWAYYPRLRYTTENGITLCNPCHKDFHKINGRIKNTRKQLTNWML